MKRYGINETSRFGEVALAEMFVYLSTAVAFDLSAGLETGVALQIDPH